MCVREEGWRRWAAELSEAREKLEEAREGVSPGLAMTSVPGVFPRAPPSPTLRGPTGPLDLGLDLRVLDPLLPGSRALCPSLDQGWVLGNNEPGQRGALTM